MAINKDKGDTATKIKKPAPVALYDFPLVFGGQDRELSPYELNRVYGSKGMQFAKLEHARNHAGQFKKARITEIKDHNAKGEKVTKGWLVTTVEG